MRSVDDWRTLFFNKIYPRLDNMAAQAIPGTAQEIREAREKCAGYLLDWLNEKGFAQVHDQYRGKASPMAYFLTVLKNRLLDCLRAELGRPRVPRSVQRQGAAYEKIYQLFYLKKRSEEQVINAMAVEPYKLSEAETRGILFWLWARYPLDPGFPAGRDPAAGPQKLIPGEFPEISRMVAVLRDLLRQSRPPGKPDLKAAPPWVWQLRQAIKLTEMERLVLQMLYRDDMSLAEAGRLLRLRRSAVEKLRREALKKIRVALEGLGGGPEILGQLEEQPLF